MLCDRHRAEGTPVLIDHAAAWYTKVTKPLRSGILPQNLTAD
jgi:hypothetical protein